MSKPPLAMRTNGRNSDPYFHPDEFLFRRVPIRIWDDPSDRPGPEAIELPDISVGRSKYAHAEWVRFDVANNHHFEDWGVLAVQVRDIPPQFWTLGIYQFTFEPYHDPLEKDYAHSEIRAFSNGIPVRLNEELPEDLHLKWRLALLKVMEAVIKPNQLVSVRENPPVSYKLEPHRVESPH